MLGVGSSIVRVRRRQTAGLGVSAVHHGAPNASTGSSTLRALAQSAALVVTIFAQHTVGILPARATRHRAVHLGEADDRAVAQQPDFGAAAHPDESLRAGARRRVYSESRLVVVVSSTAALQAKRRARLIRPRELFGEGRHRLVRQVCAC